MLNQNETKPTDTKSSDPRATLMSNIKEGMTALCSKGIEFGIVDRMLGNTVIKLNKDDKGVHHFIPGSWIARVDDKVHADRPSEEIKSGWMTTPPKD